MIPGIMPKNKYYIFPIGIIKFMSWSVWAFIIALAVSFFSMGMVGAVVYIVVSPILRLKYPPMNQWSGDWVWPANIIASLVWCLGFLIAGVVNMFIQHYNSYIYLGVLWFWGLLVWWVVLMLSYKN